MRRPWIVRETIQTSSMDCGPAALHSLLQALDRPVDYEVLRDLCQTDVDGTSIDEIESIANDLGLEAEQVMVPKDHLYHPASRAFPCVLVTLLPNGFVHFVAVWNTIGPWIQVMDPAHGRRFVRRRQLLRDAYEHVFEVPADAWFDWACSQEFREPLGHRIRALGVSASEADALLERAVEGASWERLAALDAAVRLLTVARGGKAETMGGRDLDALVSNVIRHPGLIPPELWTVTPTGVGRSLKMRGALLVRIDPERDKAATTFTVAKRPRRERVALFDLVRDSIANRGSTWAMVAWGVLVGSLCVVLEALALRVLVDADALLGSWVHVAGVVLAVAGLGLTVSASRLLVDVRSASLGRSLEGRLRAELVTSFARLPPDFFRSRPNSDLAERVHEVGRLQGAPIFIAHVAGLIVRIVAVSAALLFLYPSVWAWTVAAAAAAVALPLATVPWLAAIDARQRTHGGALTRFYLDTLVGLTVLFAHGAERSQCVEHESLLVRWAREGFLAARASAALELLFAVLGALIAMGMVVTFVRSGGERLELLLLAYWGLSLPALSETLTATLKQYPTLRNVAERATAPLRVARAHKLPDRHIEQKAAPGVVRLHQVGVQRAGRDILTEVDLTIRSGEHIAIVGASGAGKSTLTDVLLGWVVPSSGDLFVDGRQVAPPDWHAYAAGVSWLAPSVALWNDTVLQNIRYGGGRHPRALPIEEARLHDLLARLPLGLQTKVGEAGRRLSGGEGQRVRLARALYRDEPWLVVMDEAMRGLDPERRRTLLGAVRARWRGVSLLYVTHEISEALMFDRAVVLESGRIVEDGDPRELIDRDTRLGDLVRRHEESRVRVHDSDWRSVEVGA